MAELMENFVADAFETRTTDEKGVGCFATRDINAGELLLKEKAHLVVPESTDSSRGNVITFTNVYDELSVEDQERFLELYHWEGSPLMDLVYELLVLEGFAAPMAELYTRAWMIHSSNSYGLKKVAVVTNGTRRLISRGATFLRASRFNHSCDPNLAYTVDALPGYYTLSANRPIKADEELTVSYIPIFRDKDERHEETMRCWGFICACHRCQGWNNDPYDQQLRAAVESKTGLPASPLRGGDRDYMDVLERLEERVRLLTELDWGQALYFAKVYAAEFFWARYLDNKDDPHEVKTETLDLLQHATKYLTEAMAGGRAIRDGEGSEGMIYLLIDNQDLLDDMNRATQKVTQDIADLADLAERAAV
ncbi:hypothetical protein GGR54DRAFT_582839 [Hypoxylon sp. NC1633]|nr:hypothetical protein GGR54DRAFT_582839 [Hypoxylon sp. NC1633]